MVPVSATDNEPDLPPEAARAAAVLAQIRAGVRQRQALLATQPEDAPQLPASLAQVHATQYLERPVPQSHRRWLGRPIVFAKKVVYHVFMKWYLGSVLEQQRSLARALAERRDAERR